MILPRGWQPEAAARHAAAPAGHPHRARNRQTDSHRRYLESIAARRQATLPGRGSRAVFSFAIALLISTWSILSIGFLIASMVPTARFAQPIGAVIMYPMIGLSGLFLPFAMLPPVLHTMARMLPLTYAVALLQGIWNGDAWSAHIGDVAALVLVFVACTALSARIFRWE